MPDPNPTAAQPRLLINNQWRDTATLEPVINPFTGAPCGQAPLGDEALLREAIAAAHAAFPMVRALPSHTRVSLLRAIAAGIQDRRAEFVETLVSEVGKPLTYAEAEVTRAIQTFQAASEEAGRAHGELLALDGLPPGEGHFGLARRFPIGVIAAITPFNFPLNLVAHKVAPCIASGNTMVVKPAPKTPLSALLLAEVLVAAGLPAGQVNFVTCPNDAAATLVSDERVAKISFTGSGPVGWQLKALCGKKKITLELGGNAAVIVHSDANLAAAIPAIALGGFAQAGQSCISVQRILVHEDRYAEFRAGLIAQIERTILTGDPRERTTVVGPLINAQALARVQAQIAEARASGATLVHGGRALGPCLEATVLEDLSPECELMRTEVFAPVVTLHRYRTFDEALDLVNASAYGLQAGAYTQNLNLAMRAYERLEVGGVLINQVPTWRVETMPYGGIKDSGFGREGIRYAMEEMTELKTLIMKYEL